MDQLSKSLAGCQLERENNKPENSKMGLRKQAKKSAQCIKIRAQSQPREQHANNNDEDYANCYSSSPVEDGRVSGGSQESAFSTSSNNGLSSSLSSCSGADSNDFSNSSGRSSADRDLFVPATSGDADLSNTRSNLIPEELEALKVVETIRVKFLESLNDRAELAVQFDVEDLNQMRIPLLELKEYEQALAFRLISRFVSFHQLIAKKFSQEASDREVSIAIEKVKELLKFRHYNNLSGLLDDDFAKEFYLLAGIFQFGYDKHNIPILYLRARIHRKWSQKLDEAFKRFVAYNVNRLTKSYADAKVDKVIGLNQIDKDGSFAICFDCLHVSYSCVDMDFLRYLVRLLVHYYPTYCRYALCVDLPWLFRSVWKLVQTWLPEDARNSVHLITAKQLVEYVDETQIPNSMKINDLKGSEKPTELRHRMPKNFADFKSIEELAASMQVSLTEVKQFKDHVSKVVKEYELLGA